MYIRFKKGFDCETLIPTAKEGGESLLLFNYCYFRTGNFAALLKYFKSKNYQIAEASTAVFTLKNVVLNTLNKLRCMKITLAKSYF